MEIELLRQKRLFLMRAYAKWMKEVDTNARWKTHIWNVCAIRLYKESQRKKERRKRVENARKFLRWPRCCLTDMHTQIPSQLRSIIIWHKNNIIPHNGETKNLYRLPSSARTKRRLLLLLECEFVALRYLSITMHSSAAVGSDEAHSIWLSASCSLNWMCFMRGICSLRNV